MVAPSITEDYYLILEVTQTATPELITRSYKRLALKLHPDRNSALDATEAFQKLGQAYETLRDDTKRRTYDLIYPSITRNKTARNGPYQSAQASEPKPASTSQSEAVREAAQIAALKKSKQERGARWWLRKNRFESNIFELKREIRRLRQEISNLESISTAEIAEEALKNSWTAWLMSPVYKRKEDSDEEKAYKDIKKQERRIEKDMKERRLLVKEENLKKEEDLFKVADDEVEAADRADNRRIQAIMDKIQARERWERMEKERAEREKQEKLRREREERERAERERQAKIWKQQEEERLKRARAEMERLEKIRQQQQKEREKRDREAAEAYRKLQAEAYAAQQKRHQEYFKQWQARDMDLDMEWATTSRQPARPNISRKAKRHNSTSSCIHDGWWNKVHGRRPCPHCFEIWTYLLKCPTCSMEACPKCQAEIRPRFCNPHGTAGTGRKVPPRVRSPSPDWDAYF